MILVIGANSYIGKHLYEYFSKKEKVIGTYFSKPTEGLIYFDLRNPDLSNLGDLSEVRYAIICSAIAKIDDCKKYEEETYKINVEGTKKLIEQLFGLGIIPVFLSTNYVFDGEKGDYDEEDETNPKTAYGKHKKAIEDFLINNNKKFIIIRLSKVFSLGKGDNTLLSDLVEKLPKNTVNRYATDQIFSPVYIEDVVKAVDLAIEKNLSGIYHVSGREKFSWFDLATLINKEFKLNAKIIPCSIRDFNFLENERPLDIALNVNKVVEATGLKFTRMQECIYKLKEAYNITS